MASCDKFTKCLLEMFSRVLEKTHKMEKREEVVFIGKTVVHIICAEEILFHS